MDDNGVMEGGTTWFLPNGNPATTQTFNINPVVLIISPPFNYLFNDTGTYTCSHRNMSNGSFGDTIMLTAQCEFVILCSHVY